MKECLNCGEWRMRESALMRYGLGRCLASPHPFTQPRHSCQAHIEVPQDTAVARFAWLEKHGLGTSAPLPSP